MATKKPDPPEGKTAKTTDRSDEDSKSQSGVLAKAVSARTAAAKAEPLVLDQPETAEDQAPEPADMPQEKAGPAWDEPETPDKAEPPADDPEDVAAPSPRRRSGLGVFAGLVGGGVVAAAIGYFGAGYLNPPPVIPDYGAEIRAAGVEHDREIAALKDRIAELESAAENAPLARLEREIAELKAAVGAEVGQIATRLAETEKALDQKIAELDAARARLTENMSASGAEISAATAELVARYGAEIDSLKAEGAALSERLDQVAGMAGEQLQSARQTVGELSEKISDTAGKVDLTLARDRLNAAVASGKSYAEQLVAIAKHAAIEIPEALMKDADTGVAPMLELQQGFPDAARDALKASIQAEAGPGVGAKLTAFLKARLGARSLEEKEGSDPDAILSRAEAALGRGELREAVDLVRQLPPKGVASMSDWLAAAESRLAVQEALAKFNNSLDTKQ